MNKKKAIIFDLDDTLIDRNAAIKAYSEVFVDKHFPCVDICRRSQMIADMANNDSHGYIDRKVFFRIITKLWDWKDAPTIEFLEEEWNDGFPKQAIPMENMNFVLDELKRKSYKIGLITNGVSLFQNTKINVIGIRCKLDDIIISKEVMMKKPDPEIFNLACSNLNLQPEEVIFVGDNLRNDVYGSINAGMAAVWLNNVEAYDEIEDDVNCIRIRHLIELLEII